MRKALLRTIDLDEAQVISRFVKLKPRQYQTKCVSELLQALRGNNDTVLMLPTGMGKSAIYLPISMVAADEGFRSLILCATNLLLDQVKNVQARKFGHNTSLYEIKGLEHYECRNTGQKAEYLFCSANPERGSCTCGINQDSFERERFIITNFAKFLSTPLKNKFDLIVIDDSHGFENAVEDQFQHQEAYDRVDELFRRHDVAGDLIGEVAGNFMDIFDDIVGAVPPDELTRRVPDDDIKKIAEIEGSEELPANLRNLNEIDRQIYLDLFYFIKKCRDLTQNTFYVQKDYYNPLNPRDSALLSRKSDRYIENVMRIILGEARVLLVSAYPGKIDEHAFYSTRRQQPIDRIRVVPEDKPEEVKRWFRNLSLFEVIDVNNPIESAFDTCVNLTSDILQRTSVKSLLLFKNYRDQRRAEIALKQKVKGRKITFIDDTFETEKVQSLVEEADVIMVSASSRLWEGINISRLRLEIIFSLPFIRPPVYLDRTRSYPYVRRKMLIRLQQGIGRLIRDPEDNGVCVILDYANRPSNQTSLSNHVNSRDFSPELRERISKLGKADVSDSVAERLKKA
jgi:Rad3-related DNA helicase